MMKAILSIFFFALSLTVNATDYYFALNGNDANPGTQAQPFQSITKLNAMALAGSSGDIFLLRRGDVFTQTATIRNLKSGQTIDAYGTGALPVITSFVKPTSFTNTSGNYWQTSINCGPRLNMLIKDGNIVMRGRFPNVGDANGGYLPFQSHSGSTQITASNYGGINWAANGTAELFVRIVRWMGNTYPITSQSGGTFTYSGGDDIRIGGLQPIDGFGFFVMNDVRTLDQQNEWFYNYNGGSPYLVYYSSVNPATLNIQVATVDTAIIISNKSNVTIQNIAIKGNNRQSINMYVCNNININHCEIYNSGMDAVKGDQCPSTSFTYNKVYNSNNRAVDISPFCNTSDIEHNDIYNVGVNLGLGDRGDLCNTGIFFQGDGSMCEFNTLRNVGYQGIVFTGSNVQMLNNYVDSFCLKFDDGAAFYTSGFGSGRVMKKCIATNGIGNNQGTNSGGLDLLPNAFGCDDVAEYVLIDSCFAYNVAREGAGLHNNRNDTVRNCMFVNIGQRSVGMAHDALQQDYHTRGMVFRNNVYVSYSTLPSYRVYDPVNTVNSLFLMDTNDQLFSDLQAFGTSDYNYFYKPFGTPTNDFINVSYRPIPPGTTVGPSQDDSNFYRTYFRYSLPEWQRVFGQDLHSVTGILYSPYKVLTQSANQYPQGQFNASLGSLLNASSGSSTVSWDNTAQLDGGSVKAVFTGSADTTQGFSLWFYDPANNQDIAAGTVYLVDFDMLNTDNAEASANLIIQATGSGISLPVSFKFGPGRSHHQVRFTASDIPTTITGHYINMQIPRAKESHTFYVDNFVARPATTSEIIPSDYLSFVYALDQPLTYATPQPYWDYQRNAVGLIKVIPPYTAAILFKNPTALRVTGRIRATTQ